MRLVGKKVGCYEVVGEVGSGGMGIVYKAVHEKLGRTVVLKMLAPHLSNNPEMKARFLREARLQAELSHPNVVNIFDYFEQDENVFLVMEYVKGQSLDDMLSSRGKLSVEEVLYIADGVLQALSFMHKKGIIHRDIKPNNIMISETGVVKVTDFGVARLISEEEGITKVGTKVGTLYYMAPELIKAGQITPLIDIYALGITLYQLLTGRVPFTGTTDYEIIQGHLMKKPPPLDLFSDNIPRSLENLVNKAIAKNPRDRFSSADEFLKAVKALRSSTDVEQVSDSEIKRRFNISVPKTAFRIKESFLKRKAFFIGGVVVVVVVILMVAIMLLRWERGKEVVPEEKERPKIPVIGKKEPISIGGEINTVTGAKTSPWVVTPILKKQESSPTTIISEELKKELLGDVDEQEEATGGKRPKKGVKNRPKTKRKARIKTRNKSESGKELTKGWRIIK